MPCTTKMLVKMALRDADLDIAVRVIEDGEQAIAFIEAVDEHSNAPPIDLILLDMNLPNATAKISSSLSVAPRTMPRRLLS
jgi:CheY-like chemotaxis protein